LGSGAPKGRIPLTRPRRDRAMGSSILASLSEAGGNDSHNPVNGPLPPHLPDGADRVGTRPTPFLLQVACPFVRLLPSFSPLPFQQLIRSLIAPRPVCQARIGNHVPVWRAPTTHCLDSYFVATPKSLFPAEKSIWPSHVRPVSRAVGFELRTGQIFSKKFDQERFAASAHWRAPALSLASPCRIMESVAYRK
jgi:hypothetical protein